MNKKKKILITLILSLVIFGLSANLTSAGPEDSDMIKRLTNTGQAAEFAPVTTYSLPRTIGQIIKVFLSILGILFMSYIVYAGYLWMTAGGNEERLNKAKAIIRGSIIGLIIALSAYIITATAVEYFTRAGGYEAASIESGSKNLC